MTKRMKEKSKRKSKNLSSYLIVVVIGYMGVVMRLEKVKG